MGNIIRISAEHLLKNAKVPAYLRWVQTENHPGKMATAIGPSDNIGN